jgi:Domain of unknown function (DUF5655)/Endonuclease NucS C-terminal domain
LVSFKHIDFEEERELEAELKTNPGQIEDGMTFLDHQVPTGRGFIDLLCADKGGTPTVVELKINEDDSMLPQALDYCDWVNENIDRLVERYPKLTNEVARVILVAPNFSERLQRAAKYVTPELDLLEYEYLQSNNGEKGLNIRSKELGRIKIPISPTAVEDHIGYIRNPAVLDVAKKVVERIQSLDPNIELNPTQYYLGFQYKNRNIAAIHTRKDYFYLDYYDGGDWNSVTIRKTDDFTEDVFNKIKARYSQFST